MKCCVSTDVGTRTNWLTFEPDPDYNPDARTRLLFPLSYKRWYAEFYVGKIRRIRRIRIGRCSDAWFYNGFIRWASEPSKHLCRTYTRSTECPSSCICFSLLRLASKSQQPTAVSVDDVILLILHPNSSSCLCFIKSTTMSVTIFDNTHVMRIIIMNFNYYKSNISKRNLYSKWNIQIT